MIALDTDLGSILDTKILPQSAPRGSRMALKMMIIFECLQAPPEINFFGQHGPILPPKTVPSWSQNATEIGPKTASKAKPVPEPILDSFWIDF